MKLSPDMHSNTQELQGMRNRSRVLQEMLGRDSIHCMEEEKKWSSALVSIDGSSLVPSFTILPLLLLRTTVCATISMVGH